MVDYYDQLLVAIIAVIAAGAAASLHPSIELHQGLAGGSLVSTVFLYELLFRNPPVDPTRTTTAAAAVGAGWLLTLVLTL